MLATGSMLTARQLAAPGDLLPSSRRASSGWQRRQRSRARQLAPAAAATVEPEDKKDAPEETKTATKPAVRVRCRQSLHTARFALSLPFKAHTRLHALPHSSCLLRARRSRLRRRRFPSLALAVSCSCSQSADSPVCIDMVMTSRHPFRLLPAAELMGFKGAAPEIINGRLAMLGFSAALGAELRGGGSCPPRTDTHTPLTCALALPISGVLDTAVTVGYLN